jgi:hypothetical protein
MGMLLAVVAALALAAPEPGDGRIVEEIVAVVRNPATAPPRIVTLTKLTEEARVALVSRGATAAASGPLDAEALRAALEWLLAEILVADDAERLRVYEIPREEVLAELGRFRARFAARGEYERFLAGNELSEEELLVVLTRNLRVRRYLESRAGRAARVDDRDVERWLEARGAAGASGPVRDAARAELVEERTRTQVRELVEELRSRADVRVLGTLSVAGGEG